MSVLLTGFIAELRESGVPVSIAETIDAARAVRHVDLGDRSALKAALGATLVKTARHYPAFESAFDVYFGLRAPGAREEEHRAEADLAALQGAGPGPGAGGSPDAAALIDALVAALADGNMELLDSVIRQSVRSLSGMEPGRPVGGGYYLHRILRQLGWAEIERRLLEATRTVETGFAERLHADEVRHRLEAVRAAIEAEIRRRLVADRGAPAVARALRRPPLEDVDLTTANREQQAEIGRAIQPLARRLAVRLARLRRRGRVGRLDVRATLRSALGTGGVPVDPRFRRPRPGRPELVVLADVSGSMATFSRFTLQIVYALASQFRRVRAFAFIDAIDEVTGFLGPGVDFGQAVARIGEEARIVWLDGHSDYGHALGAFETEHLDGIRPDSIVIVAGDARTNYHEPNVPALEAIAAHTRGLFWINPEPVRYWNTGDSVMGRYAPVCDGVFEVRTLRQLDRFVERVAIPLSRPITARFEAQAGTRRRR